MRFLDKLRACLPIGYTAILLDQNTQDIACNWRRFRIYKNEKFKDINVTPEDYGMSLDDIEKAFAKPICRLLEEKKEFIGNKMTRYEAIELVKKSSCTTPGVGFVAALEALGLLKFEPEKASKQKGKYIFFPSPDENKDNVGVLQSDAVETMKKYGFEFKTETYPTIKLNSDKIFGDVGIISIERWPEGLVLWVGGEIVYRSWKP